MKWKTTTYWKCVNLSDDNAYSIRTKTRREAAREKEEREREGWGRYGDPVKVEVRYWDRMDLIRELLGENSGDY